MYFSHGDICSALKVFLESLKVFVQLEAVIPTVGYHYVPVQGQGQPLRAIQRTGQSVDKGEERALAVKDLDA